MHCLDYSIPNIDTILYCTMHHYNTLDETYFLFLSKRTDFFPNSQTFSQSHPNLVFFNGRHPYFSVPESPLISDQNGGVRPSNGLQRTFSIETTCSSFRKAGLVPRTFRFRKLVGRSTGLFDSNLVPTDVSNTR